MKNLLLQLLGIGTVEASKIGPNPTNQTVAQIIAGYLDTALWLLGAVAVGMIIYSGILFITSAGDPEKVKVARGTLTWAVIGVLVVALSAGIVVLLTKVVANGFKL